MRQAWSRLSQGVRWRLGMRVAARELEAGEDQSMSEFYRGRITDCMFLSDPHHYEHPRARWVLERVRGGRLLEVGSGNGGMTRLLAPKVDHLVALDVSEPSLACIIALGLGNVVTVNALVEQYEPQMRFDWIVMSEVLEHLRKPQRVVAGCLKWLLPGGSMLMTTPNGHWESDEHLHEFNLRSLAGVVAQSGAEAISVTYLRDAQERRRWLAAELTMAERPPAADEFNNRPKVGRKRRRR